MPTEQLQVASLIQASTLLGRVFLHSGLCIFIFIILHELGRVIRARQVQKDQQRTTSEGFFRDHGGAEAKDDASGWLYDLLDCFCMKKRAESGNRDFLFIEIMTVKNKDLYFQIKSNTI